MRPDVALAFDRMSAAARAAGVALMITSAFRTNAEQAALFAAHPDPKWVAPPGQSLHRLGTELDLGPASALRLAGGQRQALRLRPAVLLGGLALRVHKSSAGTRSVGFGPGDGRSGVAVLCPGALGACDLPRRAALERRRCAARRPALAGVALQPVRAVERRGPRHRTIHAGHGQGLQLDRSLRWRGSDPRPGPSHARPARRSSARCRSPSPPITPGRAPRAACGCIPQIPETVSYVSTILGLLGGTGDPAALATGLQGAAGGMSQGMSLMWHEDVADTVRRMFGRHCP